jgi:predicted TIM-barrel fold metal-dependent hydrolase
MDECGIDLSVVSGLAGLDARFPQRNYTVSDVLEWCEAHPGRMLAAMTIEGLGSISHICRMIEELAPNPAFAVVRVVPIFLEEPINSARLYPIYERCEGLGVTVSVNVGVPAPRLRTAYQDPLLLDDVLIDFPDLTIVGAHMGHPWESLLVNFMRKYDKLYLTNSGYLAKYMVPEILTYMNSSVGIDRLIFASDAPRIAADRAIESARALPIRDEAIERFLGENALAALGSRVAPALVAVPGTGR